MISMDCDVFETPFLFPKSKCPFYMWLPQSRLVMVDVALVKCYIHCLNVGKFIGGPRDRFPCSFPTRIERIERYDL